MHALVLEVPAEHVDDVSDALMDALEALSVSVDDADAQTDAEQALFGEPGLPPPAAGWQRSRLTAHFQTEAQAEEAGRLLQAQPWAGALRVQGVSEVPEQDWVRLTQSQFEPIAVTPSFWIVPSWHEPPAAARQVMRLDPGLAVGTGTHPTTLMCLRWLAARADEAPSWTRVLDYGCGSGVLALGAALFGARTIDAVDIDPAAVTATRDNAVANDAGHIRCGLPELAQGTYDVVLANILATPLKLLAPLLSAHVAPSGHLVLAGLLQRQADEMRDAYSATLDLHVTDALDGWVLMSARRPSTTAMPTP